jgi:hypothetical protein
MGIPIVRGRAFVEDDEREHSLTRKIAIINEAMAARYWPGQNPIGRRFRAYNPTDPLLEIVGIARNSKYVLVFEAPRPYIYLPLVRDLSLRTLHVRAVGDPAALARRLEREIKDLAPDLPITDLRTMDQSLTDLWLSDLLNRRTSSHGHGSPGSAAGAGRCVWCRLRSAPRCGRVRSASA